MTTTEDHRRDIHTLLLEQVDWYWRTQLRPRLDGLTDEEYFWEPVAAAWNVRPRGTGSAPVQVGSGAFTIDFAIPEPQPAPATTIAWRLGHIIVGVLRMRTASHLGGPATDYETFGYAGTGRRGPRPARRGVCRLGRRCPQLGLRGAVGTVRTGRGALRAAAARRPRPAHQP